MPQGSEIIIRRVSDERASDAQPFSADRPWMLAGLALLGSLMMLALNAATMRDTLRGAFADPDDAMRLVEVRAWLEGQSWFDLRALRLDPPGGSFMHWSRLVDLPMAAAITCFATVTDRATAEHWAAIAVPTLWSSLLFFGILQLATRLIGARAVLPTLLGLVASGTTLVAFAPGRIGHHAPETVALVFALGSVVASLERGRSRRALSGGVLVALSLAMSLETMPFDVVLLASLVLVWIVRGAAVARALGGFAIGLSLALPVFFLADVAPARWLMPICDAFGAAHLGAGEIAACGLLACAACSRHLQTPLRRAASALLVAVTASIFLATAYPACLGSPFAAVDPVVRDLWLSHVGESLPFPAFARLYPMLSVAMAGSAFLGACGLLVGAARTPAARDGFLMVAALVVAGLALAFWQVRVLASISALAMIGGVYLATRFTPAVALLVVLLFGATTWALVLPDDRLTEADAAALRARNACLSPEGLAPLATLRPGTAVAPLNTGSHLMEATRISVFAAPYHRNDDGNLFALDVFLARPEQAARLLAARRVSYVILCPGIVDLARLAARAPDGLAARLLQGEVPSFLDPLPLSGTPYRVYALSAH